MYTGGGVVVSDDDDAERRAAKEARRAERRRRKRREKEKERARCGWCLCALGLDAAVVGCRWVPWGVRGVLGTADRSVYGHPPTHTHTHPSPRHHRRKAKHKDRPKSGASRSASRSANRQRPSSEAGHVGSLDMSGVNSAGECPLHCVCACVYA